LEKIEKVKSALLAVFPTLETFAEFNGNSDNSKAVQSFIEYASGNGVIEGNNDNIFRAFISKNGKAQEDCIPPDHMNFEELFERKDDLLELNLSARALTDRINTLISENNIELPKVTNSMLTRLKREPVDTPHKQNVMRSLAFWIGHERPELGQKWNYETLLRLCRESRPSVNHKEGIRIGFALYGRGDVIDYEIMSWLKKEMKDYIEQSIDRFLYGFWGKVRSHDITTLYVDFPKEAVHSDPASYRLCLRSAVSLAHQIAIRWALSKYFTKNRFLSIGLAAGDFTVLDNYLLPILNAKLPGDPVIRITEFTRQCLLINDIRVLLGSHPNEITLFNGETLNIWWLAGLWSTLYFDFIPDLLEDKILQNNSFSVEALTGLLWSNGNQESQTQASDEPNAVTTFFKYPHNSLLGLEIAKTLYYRRSFWEALEILRIVLSIDSTHLNARTLRMVLFRNLALEAGSYTISDNLFKQAEQEARYILENCRFQSEDFYCEYAVVYLARAMLILRFARNNKEPFNQKDGLQKSKKIVFSSIDRAEDLLGMGRTVSPSGIRSIYLLNSIRILKAILESNDEIFVDPDKPIDAPPEIVKQPTQQLQRQFGYLRDGYLQDGQFDFIEKLIMNNVVTHDDSISLQAYRPTTYFCTAVTWWDLFPLRTAAIAKRTVQILSDARDIAETMGKKNVCIYSFTRTYGEMMPASEFINHMERSIQMINEYAGGALSKRDDREVLEPTGNLSSILMTLNF